MCAHTQSPVKLLIFVYLLKFYLTNHNSQIVSNADPSVFQECTTVACQCWRWTRCYQWSWWTSYRQWKHQYRCCDSSSFSSCWYCHSRLSTSTCFVHHSWQTKQHNSTESTAERSTEERCQPSYRRWWNPSHWWSWCFFYAPIQGNRQYWYLGCGVRNHYFLCFPADWSMRYRIGVLPTICPLSKQTFVLLMLSRNSSKSNSQHSKTNRPW